MRVLVYVIIAIAVIIVVYLLHQWAVRLQTHKLREELAAQQGEARKLRQELAEAYSAEPQKMQLLRKENMAYDKLVDAIQDELVAPATLQLTSQGERISNLIFLHRPERTF